MTSSTPYYECIEFTDWPGKTVSFDQEDSGSICVEIVDGAVFTSYMLDVQELEDLISWLQGKVGT